MRSDNSDKARTVVVAATIAVAVLVGGCSYKDRKDPNKGATRYIAVVHHAKDVSEDSVEFFDLRSIGLMLHTYANMNDEKFPPTLQTLVDKGLLVQKHISGKGQELHYIPGQTLMSPSSNIIAYTTQPDARGDCHVLRVSGQAELMSPQKLQAAVEATKDSLR